MKKRLHSPHFSERRASFHPHREGRGEVTPIFSARANRAPERERKENIFRKIHTRFAAPTYIFEWRKGGRAGKLCAMNGGLLKKKLKKRYSEKKGEKRDPLGGKNSCTL